MKFGSGTAPDWIEYIMPRKLTEEEILALIDNPRVLILCGKPPAEGGAPMMGLAFFGPEANFHTALNLSGAPELAGEWRRRMEEAEKRA